MQSHCKRQKTETAPEQSVASQEEANAAREAEAQTEEADEDDDGTEVFADWDVGERYEMVRLLGTGSYGQVVEAFDLQQQKKVAIKHIPSIFSDSEDTKRILREMYILRHLRHPHVIQLLDVIKPGISNTYYHTASCTPTVCSHQIPFCR
jgi:mitogen-activated protein kinase 1/3